MRGGDIMKKETLDPLMDIQNMSAGDDNALCQADDREATEPVQQKPKSATDK